MPGDAPDAFFLRQKIFAASPFGSPRSQNFSGATRTRGGRPQGPPKGVTLWTHLLTAISLENFSLALFDNRMTNYICIKCGNRNSASSHPTIGTCSKGGGHEWVVNDGIRKAYKCIKCGNRNSASSPPVVGTCSKGGGHQWVS